MVRKTLTAAKPKGNTVLTRKRHRNSLKKMRAASSRIMSNSTMPTSSNRLSGMQIVDNSSMLDFMKTIQETNRLPYHMVSNNLDLESKKSIEKLEVLIGEAGNSVGQTSFGDRRP